MDRIVECKINGETRYLNYSIAVMFEMADKFGTIQKAFERMAQQGKDGFETTKWFAIACANDGELCRRQQGYEQMPLLTSKDITMRISPAEYDQLQAAIIDATTRGYKREVVDEDEEVDLGLQELSEKKQEPGHPVED